MLGLGLALPLPPLLQGSWTPQRLFEAGGEGLWCEPGLLTALAQDAAGAVGVTAAGQPVGRVADQSGAGRHLAQATSAARPTLGRHPRSGLRNELTQSAALAGAAWAGGGGLLSVTSAAAPGVAGQMTASLLIENGAASAARNRVQGLSVVAGRFYIMSAIVKSVGPQARHVHLVYENGTAFTGNPNVTLNVLTGVVTQSGGVDRTAGAENLGNGWWRVWLRCRCVAAGLNGFRLGFSPDPASPWSSYTGDGVSGLAVDGVQVETGAAMTPYQAAASLYDVTEPGQPDVWYLSHDGVDDFLATSAINWARDEVTLIAALRKRSDAAEGNIVNFGDFGSTGSFLMAGPGGLATERFWSCVRGASHSFAISSNPLHAAPVTAIVALQGSIGADTNVLRVNGAVAASSGGDLGTAATFGTRQMFIGRRNGTTLAAAMDLYGLIAINRVLTAAELARAEQWAAEKCGVTL